MKKSILFLITIGMGIGLSIPSAVAQFSDSDPKRHEDKMGPNSPEEAAPSPGMNLSQLEQVIREAAGEVQGRRGVWRFTVSGVTLIGVVDEKHDRMRFMAPVTQINKLSEKHLYDMLMANFHTAIDARYAISNKTVYATFLHPLSSLTPKDARSAIQQVVSLTLTFGKSYSSGSLQFGSPIRQSPTQPPQTQPF